MFNNFFPENRAVYEIMWKNMVKPDKPDHNIWCIRAAWLDDWGYRHKLRTCNIYFFSTATIVTGTCLHVRIYVHCLSASRWIVSRNASDCDSRPSLYRFMHYSNKSLSVMQYCFEFAPLKAFCCCSRMYFVFFNWNSRITKYCILALLFKELR
jgi:hypothetical protein